MRAIFLVCFFCCSFGAHAAYRCEGAAGISIQDAPCRKGETARSVDLSARFLAPPPVAAIRNPKPPEAAEKSPMAKAPPMLFPFSKNPNSPFIRLAYNSAYSPFDDAKMGRLIQQAMARWNEHCNVNLVFEGFTNAETPKRQSHQLGLFIRWDNPRNPGNAAEAGPTHGITLSPHALAQRSSAYLMHVITHELGHVLGIGHIHEDPISVMSYNREIPQAGIDSDAG